MKYIILDGMNFFVRSFCANPTMDINGKHIGGFHGFYTGISKLIREHKPNYFIVAWDGAGGSLKRRSMYKDYKAGRKPSLNREYDFESPDEQIKSFSNQIKMVKDYLVNFPIINIDFDGIEADDIIAYLSNHIITDGQKIIVSSDKDFYQLLNEDTIVYSPTKKMFFTEKDLLEKYFLIPENFIYYKAITGDDSDNVKGVKGIGDKTFFKMFDNLKDKEITTQELFEFCDLNKEKNKKFIKILENKETIVQNISLMQLSNPNMLPQISSAIRSKIENKNINYKPLDLKIKLSKDGIAFNNANFFDEFRHLLLKSKI